MPEPVATEPLSPREALDRLGQGWDTESVGVLAGQAVLAVDLDAGTPAEAEQLAAVCRLLPVVVVGVRDRAPTGGAPEAAFDVLVCQQASPPPPWVGPLPGQPAPLDTLHRAVAASPVAAVALAQVLRAGRRLDVTGALTLESVTYGALQAGSTHQQWLAAKATKGGVARVEGDEPAVLTDRVGDTLHLTLNRPWVRNAYDARMRDDLVAALAVAAADPAVDVVLDGAGPSFCSGGDLVEFGTATDPADAHVIRTTRSAGHRLYQLRHRTTVRVQGACVGAGIELPAFAGRIEAHPGSRFSLPEVSMGLIPGAGGTASIPRRIGPERTAWLGLTGVALDAATARRWGLVDTLIGTTDPG